MLADEYDDDGLVTRIPGALSINPLLGWRTPSHSLPRLSIQNLVTKNLVGREIEVLVWQPLLKSHICGARMPFHAFQARNARAGWGNLAVGLSGHALPGHGLEEFAYRKPPGVSRGAVGR